jgi:imidazolonepropionase-like amidohydrolase
METIYTGATIHIGNGNVIERGCIGFLNGKIFLITDTLKSSYKNANQIDVSGKHIYPAFIGLNTFAGLNEIDAVRATHDYNEVQSYNPNVHSQIAYNTDSKIIPTFISTGVLLIQSTPQGGILSGKSSLMKTQGWNWEDATYYADDGLHINWPELRKSGRLEKNDESEKRNQETLNEISTFFDLSNAYLLEEKHATANIRFEAMREILNGNKNLYVHVNSSKGILSAIQYLHKFKSVKLVLVGAEYAYLHTDLLKSKHISVIIDRVHRLPSQNHHDIDKPYKNAVDLYKSGILTAIGYNGSWESRNIPFNAGTLATYGLSKEEALSCITSNAAKILGIYHRVGSLEQGKDATFIISEGDVLDMKSNQIVNAYIMGEELSLSNAQIDLFRKYLKKYGIQK